MNIEEIKDYINSKKDKIKSGAIKATSTALVAGMLLSGGLGLTGCVKDPNNQNEQTHEHGGSSGTFGGRSGSI